MKQKFLFIVLLLLTVNAFAQSDEAQKLDEFGYVNCDEYLARMDAVIIAQANNPNSQIYVFVYEGKEKRGFYKNDKMVWLKPSLPPSGLAKAKIDSMKEYIKKWKKRPVENYVFVNGGFREEFQVEIWLVPPGAEPPTPTPTLQKMEYRKGGPRGFCTSCC